MCAIRCPDAWFIWALAWPITSSAHDRCCTHPFWTAPGHGLFVSFHSYSLTLGLQSLTSAANAATTWLLFVAAFFMYSVQEDESRQIWETTEVTRDMLWCEWLVLHLCCFLTGHDASPGGCASRKECTSGCWWSNWDCADQHGITGNWRTYRYTSIGHGTSKEMMLRSYMALCVHQRHAFFLVIWCPCSLVLGTFDPDYALDKSSAPGILCMAFFSLLIPSIFTLIFW